MKVALTLVLMTFFLVGCNRRASMAMQSFKYHEDARRKPVVAMLPVINRVQNNLPWDLSEELTSEIQRRLMHHSVIYLNSTEMTEKLRQKLDENDSILLKKEDYSEYKAHNDFLVLLELIEHSETPYHKSQTNEEYLALQALDRILNIKMRVKVLDLRLDEPKIVLQEILEKSHLIPSDAGSADKGYITWGSDAYPATAYGRAHAMIEKDASTQIEKYISIAH